MDILIALVVFTVACLAGCILTPMVARIARRLGAVDGPDGHRKNQQSAISTGGGVAVALAATAAFVLVVLLVDLPSGLDSGSLLTGLLPAALVLLATGLIDDFRGLTGIYKLLGQMLAVSLLIAGGFDFHYISLFWVGFPLGNFSVPFTMFFCLGAINAFNLIDGIDALASSVGTVICFTLGIISASQGDVIASLVCFAFAGALVGFLRYNIPPAKIYLGDTGSMLIGLVVAAVAIHCSIKEETTIALFVPIAICAIPILDAAAALVRRMTTGQSVFTPDRGHLHHALLLRGWSVGKTVAFISGLTAITCGGALLSYYTNNEAYALAVTGGVFIALASAKVFGHAEVSLLVSHSRATLSTLLHFASRGKTEVLTEKSIQLQGDRKWETIWLALREAVPVYNLADIKMTINIPHLHEAYYASWKQSKNSSGDAWKIALPLLLEGRQIGKLSLTGNSSGSKGLVEMQQMLDFLEPLEMELEHIIAEVATPKDPVLSKPSKQKKSLVGHRALSVPQL